MWSKGIIDGFNFQVKHYKENSRFGIGGGRISKLWIAKDGMEEAFYERGWAMRPKTMASKKVYEELLKRYN